MSHPYLGLKYVALLLTVATASAQTPVPGKFYEYYVVAKTGAGFTDLGAGGGPSINDSREVAFRGATASGNGLWFGTGAAAAVNFNPGESFGSSDIIQPSVQINANHQVVAQDRITTTSPATTAVRLYTTAADSFIYGARGGPLHTGVGVYLYDAVFANPATNKNGDVVFTAQYSSQAPAKVLGYLAAGSSTPVEKPIRSGNPKPMIADNGTVVIQVGGAAGQANLQILAYPPGLGTPAVIADTNANWVSLDNDPGISRDGRIIVFQGNPDAVKAAALGTTTGVGIFAAIDEGLGFGSAKIIRITGGKVEDVAADRAATKGNFDGICDIGEICKAAAELGFDASGNPITIASYPADSRVGVVNLDLGDPGIDNDTFVVSFLGTPSGASRDNPALPGTPLLFSSQLGLWTIRVDVQKQLTSPGARVYHPFTPIPVVQIGDKIGGDTVTGLGVYDPIANAAHDESGNIRTMRRGDHRVAFWASTNNGQIIVRGNHIDSDQDGLLDHWETTGIDMNQDGVVDLNLAAYGADPFKRDLFVQVDWVGVPGMPSPFKPAGGVFSADVAGSFSDFENNYRNAEALSGSMYGARIDGSNPIPIAAGVAPHIDAGTGADSLGLPMSINLSAGPSHGGNSITMANDANTTPAVVYFGQPSVPYGPPGINARAFQDIKDNNFGLSDNNARLLAFHYAVFAPFQDFQPNYPKTPLTATISAVSDLLHVELNAPLSSLSIPKGSFVALTSGADAGDIKQIFSKATNGVTGNGVLTLGAALRVSPQTGDTVVFLEGSTGNSEVAFSPAPDHNSLPGNDVIISAGAMGVLQGVAPNRCMEYETAAHELGHTLGLRHGGTDQEAFKGDQFLSIMSYTWQLECNPPSAVKSYSKQGDPTFDDYANMQFNFTDVLFHLSTSLGTARGEGTQPDMQQQVPEQTLLDVIQNHGALDVHPPVVQITSPAAASNVSLGSMVTVNVTVTDDIKVDHVTASFDINGNGVVEPGESVLAASTGPTTYQATFPSVSGPSGSRTVGAIGWDSFTNSTLATINVNVGAAAQVAVPNALNQTQASATTAITAAGLVVGTVTTAASNTVPSGSVISEIPAPGTLVNPGSSVNLVISIGPNSMAANAGTTPQSATINTAFANALAVTVKDGASNPVSGVNVTFTAPGSGASGKFSNSTATITVATNASGVASAPFTANGTAGGPYTVTAAATGLTSVNFSLTNSGAGPVITTNPADVTVNAGGTAIFTAAATGTPTPTVQWQFSTDGGASFNNVAGATTTTLTIPNVLAGQNGTKFRAVFTNASGSATTTAATMTVNFAPTVTTNPTSQSVSAGSTATFVAAASGNPTPTVQWQLSTNGGATFANIAGATSTTLSFTALASQNGNQFRAVFTNTVGSATTTAATLTVTAGPVITTNPADVTVNAGGTAVFTAAATGTPTPTVQWQFSTDGGASFNNVAGATTTTLTIPNVLAGQNGTKFRAVFTNASGSATTTAATMTVNFAPTVTTNPTSQSVSAGSTATFVAAASGNPTPTVQWQLSTNGGATFANIAGATSTTLSFTASASQNGNQFRAVFTNTVGSATTTAATLTVTAGPVITTNPADVTVNAGGTAIFTAAASGTPTPTVQWQFSTDGGASFNNVAGATTTTLTIPNVLAGQNGTKFRAVFTNASGSATTTAATMTVNFAPTVTTNPTSQSVSAGSIATFVAAASGNPTPTVQWQLSTNGGATFANIAGATSTTLSFTASASQNGNQFRAVFTNTVGSATTTAATLTVTAGPVITQNPSDVTVNAGGTAVFTAAATGTPTPTVQWQFSTDGGASFNNVAGATTTTLTIPNVLAGQNGTKFRAVFTNASGSATTTAATMTVNFAPTVTTNPTSQSVSAGSTATFVAAASGNPTPTVQWQLSTNGGATFANIAGATSTTLSFTALASQNGNQFRAVFTNTVGSATTTAATLTVTAGPVITTNPADVTVNAGGTAVFTAAATGTPTPTVQWQFSTDGGASFNNVAGATTTTLTIPNVLAGQNGTKFRAVFTNASGSATTTAATMTVASVPATITDVSSTNANGTYTAGSVLALTISFNRAVVATGVPLLALNSGGTATYSSGSGSATLTFTYKVAAGQNSAHLDATSSGALTLNGGAIVDGGGQPATLTLPAPGAAGSLGANKSIVIDTVSPTVVSYNVLWGSQSFNVIGAVRNRLPWQVTGIQVVFSKPIASADLNSLGGAAATAFSGLGTNTLTWTISPLALGNFPTTLAGSGVDAIRDSSGNALTGGAGFSQSVKILYGDFNDDGNVNSQDMVSVNNAAAAPYNIFADINGDGVVNITDVQIVRTRIGTSLP